MGSMTDVGIDDNFIKQARDKITPGTSALFLYTDKVVQDKVLAEFKAMPGNPELMQSNLSGEQEAKLREAFGEEAEAARRRLLRPAPDGGPSLCVSVPGRDAPGAPPCGERPSARATNWQRIVRVTALAAALVIFGNAKSWWDLVVLGTTAAGSTFGIGAGIALVLAILVGTLALRTDFGALGLAGGSVRASLHTGLGLVERRRWWVQC